MRFSKVTTLISILFLSVLFAGTASASDKEKEVKEIGKMGLRELTSRATAGIDRKYPGENWEKYNFPKYVYTNDAVQTGYRIAVKESPLLAKFPCYCFCEEMGHKNLAYCFLEKGVLGKFDDHASTCNICYTQAMRAFLWRELGATDEEMLKAMKEAYEK